MRRALVGFLFILMMAVLAPAAYGSGTIYGIVVDPGGASLEGITVQVFDATNAVLVAETSTGKDNFKGFSVAVPAGSYKLRFSGTVADNCYAEFYGTEGLDVFYSGLAVRVLDGEVTYADARLLPQKLCGPVKCLAAKMVLQATVYDSQTEQPVSGIQVTLVDPVNAVPWDSMPLVTDGNGLALFSALICEKKNLAKARIADPTGLYMPEFYGAGDRDSFEFGATLNLISPPGAEFKEVIARVPPAQVVQKISQELAAMGLDPQTQQGLNGTLSAASQVLADDNPNNDKGACGMLTGFTSQLDNKVRKGLLAQAQADALAASAEQARNTLGCK